MLNKVLDYIGTPRMAVLAAGVYALILLLAATCQGRPPQCTLPERSQLTNVWVVDSERHYGSVTDLPARPPQRSTTNATGKGSNGNGDHTLSSRKKAVRRGCACSGGCTCGCNEGAPCTCGQATGVNVSRAFLGVPTAPLASLAPVQPQPLQACCTSSCENMPYRVAGTGFLSGVGAVGVPHTHPVRYATPLAPFARPLAMNWSPAPAFRPAPAMMGGGGGFGFSRGGGAVRCST
jgi:hypothetical protein